MYSFSGFNFQVDMVSQTKWGIFPQIISSSLIKDILDNTMWSFMPMSLTWPHLDSSSSIMHPKGFSNPRSLSIYHKQVKSFAFLKHQILPIQICSNTSIYRSRMGFRLPGIQRRSTDVPKGCLAVYVGENQKKRFVIPISFLNEPSIQDLLSQVEQEFGFEHPMGGLTIPCREDVFLDITSRLHRS